MDSRINTKNLRNRSDYGVRVARPGYDANLCAQNQLLFNSGWPIMQITEVIDMDKAKTVEIYEYQVRTTSGQGDVRIVLSEVSEPPSGYTGTYDFNYDADSDRFRSVKVNRKYVKKYLSGTRTGYIYPSETQTVNGVTVNIDKSCTRMNVKRASHRLGYTPMFMMSEDISEVSGYAVLFSIDIANDVDYPYTEKPLQLLSQAHDYGIKSSSKFSKRVPGLCSDMFSKLVQAVKTEQTSNFSDKSSGWSPVNSPDKAKDGCVLPYEFYSFVGDSIEGSGTEGGVYYVRDYPFYLSKPSGSSKLQDAWAVVNLDQGLIVKNSLVVLRSPMVSPEYEERVV